MAQIEKKLPHEWQVWYKNQVGKYESDGVRKGEQNRIGNGEQSENSNINYVACISAVKPRDTHL